MRPLTEFEMYTDYFSASDNCTYRIDIDAEGELIRVSYKSKFVGSILLRRLEVELPHLKDYFYITNLSLDQCKHKGIGRKCLQLHKDIFDSPITASDSYGDRSDDGSHLTGDGPPFIARMIQEGIVIGHENS